MASIGDQNWVVWNQGKNPLVNFNFMLRVEMMFDLPCRSVRAFTRELEYDYIQEGGLNDYVHMRRKPISRPFTLEIERYVGVDYADPLPLGADLVLPVLLFVSRAHDQFIPGVVARTYVFTGCTVTKKTYGDLVADQSGLLVETTTIAYREMLCVDIPWSEVGDNMFASTTTLPTQAATIDKTAADLKRLGQELYEKAEAAKKRSDSEYTAEDAQKLIETLEQALKKLEKDLAAGGVLGKNLETARKGMTDSNDRPLADLAAQAQEEVAAEKEKVRTSQNAWMERDKLHSDLLKQQGDLLKQQETAEKLKKQLEDQLKQANETKTALETALPQDLRDPARAQEAVDAARTQLETAKEKLNDARLAYEQAQIDLDSKKKLDAARAAENQKICAAELEQATQRREEAEKALSNEEENNRQAAQALSQAEEAYKTAQGPSEKENLEKAQQAKEQSDKVLAERKEKLEQALKDEEEAEANKAAADADVNTDGEEKALSPEEETLAESKKAFDAATKAHDDAADAREKAGKHLEDSEALADVNEEIREINAQIAQAGADGSGAGGKAADLTEEIAKAEEEADTARTKLDEDKKELEKAQEKAQAAMDKASEARKALDKAQDAHDRASRTLSPMRNNLVNLKARKDKADGHQKSCGESYEKCKEANTALQKLPDDPLSEVNTAYEEVKKHHKDTSFYERQVREMKSYVDQGSELYEDVKDLVAEEPAEGENTGGDT